MISADNDKFCDNAAGNDVGFNVNHEKEEFVPFYIIANKLNIARLKEIKHTSSIPLEN